MTCKGRVKSSSRPKGQGKRKGRQKKGSKILVSCPNATRAFRFAPRGAKARIRDHGANRFPLSWRTSRTTGIKQITSCQKDSDEAFQPPFRKACQVVFGANGTPQRWSGYPSFHMEPTKRPQRKQPARTPQSSMLVRVIRCWSQRPSAPPRWPGTLRSSWRPQSPDASVSPFQTPEAIPSPALRRKKRDAFAKCTVATYVWHEHSLRNCPKTLIKHAPRSWTYSCLRASLAKEANMHCVSILQSL